MKPLKDVLKRIDNLSKDLSAIVVLKEEIGHREFYDPHADGYYRSQDSNGNCYCEPEIDEWVIDEPAIIEPDTPTIEVAKTALQ